MSEKKKIRAPRLTVEVTAELIRDSKKRDSSHCMIAESIKATFPGAAHISVDLQTIRFTDPKKGLRYTYLTPRKAQVAIVLFDQAKPFDPFSIRLRGGQVTRGGTGQRRKLQPLSEAQREQRAEATKRSAELARGRMAPSVDNPERGVPEKIGGKAPPTMKMRDGSDIPFSRRREYGVRALST